MWNLSFFSVLGLNCKLSFFVGGNFKTRCVGEDSLRRRIMEVLETTRGIHPRQRVYSVKKRVLEN